MKLPDENTVITFSIIGFAGIGVLSIIGVIGYGIFKIVS